MPTDPQMIQAINDAIQRDGLSWTAVPNEITDLAPEERRKLLGVKADAAELQRLNNERLMFAQREGVAAASFGAPAAIDWRNNNGNWVTPVKNQGGCGSCVAFCTCATMESAVRIKLNNAGYAVDLSEAFCQFCGGGSCGGWGLTSGLDFAKSTGVTDEACMPYQPVDMNCGASRCSDWQNRLTKISNYTGYSSMSARKDAIATRGPLLAGMAVYSDFYAVGSSVYVKTSSATLEGYHCICVVGYSDAEQCWILKNSWGTGWGSGGFCKVRYNQADLLIDTSWAFYSVDIQILPAWHSNVTVSQVFASRDSQNGWAYFAGLGWRKIQTGAADGVTNMLVLFAEAVANGKKVTVYMDGNNVFQAYLL